MEYILEIECESERTETVFCRLCDNCCIRQAGRRADYTLIQNIRLSFALHFHLVLSRRCHPFPSSFVFHLLFQSVAFFFTFCPRALHFRILFIVFHLLPVVWFSRFCYFFSASLSLSLSLFFFGKHCHYYWPRVNGMYVCVCVCVCVCAWRIDMDLFEVYYICLCGHIKLEMAIWPDIQHLKRLTKLPATPRA